MKCRSTNCNKEGEFYDEEGGGFYCYNCKNTIMRYKQEGIWGILKKAWEQSN